MYSKIFKNVLFPLYEQGIRRRNTIRYLKLMNENQWKPHDELRASQWSMLTRLLKHAHMESPYYRDLFNSNGIDPGKINNYDDFLQIPICSRDDVVRHKDQMIANSHRENVTTKSTGGSTGTPVRFALDRDSYEWRIAAAQRGYQWANCEAGQPTLYIWGVDVGKPTWPSSTKTAIYHKAFNRKMFNCFNFTDEEMLRCVKYINRHRPTGIVAFTTAVYNFAQFIRDNKLQVAQVPSILTGAEKLYPFQRELIEEVFQGKVFNTYGCREFMLIAAECDHHEGLHVTMDNLYVEILSQGKPALPGESGEIVITDLHNYGMPFIRYKNGDIATQGKSPCSCGRGLPLIQDIDGRKMDEIIATDGKIVSGGFFPHLMKEFVEIKKYQVIQNKKDHLTIKIVLQQSLPDEKLQFCKSEIVKVMGADMELTIDYVDDIPLTATGKYRTTISEIASR